jgi:glycosyltransferase involved in cell wall biosynthesis
VSGSSAIRLTFVADTHEHGGAETYLVGLASGLPDNYVLSLVATKPVPPTLAAPIIARGGHVLVTDAVAGKADLSGLRGTAGALRASDPDLVHVNLNSIANNRHAIAIAASRWPTLATLHLGSEMTSAAHRIILPMIFGRLDRLIAVSQEIASQLHDELRISESRLRVIANGVPETSAVTLREAPKPLRVGGLGRLTRQKGFDVLIEAVARLHADGVPIEAVIGGDGPELEPLARAAEGLPVHFPGWSNDTTRFLSQLDVFCLSSRWEGLPFSLLEAMMLGLPCVTTTVGDVPAATAGVGVLVGPEDPAALARELRALSGSYARRRALGTAAHERARTHFSVGQMVQSTMSVYDELLSP